MKNSNEKSNKNIKNKVNKNKEEELEEKIKEESSIENQKIKNYIKEYIMQIFKIKNIEEILYILGTKREIFKRNLIAGISKGIGIGIGFSIVTAIIIISLQKLVTLNIPIIGEYISDIVDIVENNR